MRSSRTKFKTIVLEEGMHAVVRAHSSEPHILEVVAMFYDPAFAREYADMKNGQHVGSPDKPAPSEPAAAPEEESIEANGAGSDLTERQSAVLEALRAKANDENVVEISVAALAEASGVPLGTIHSVLQSLEKKQKILTTRTGSARAPAAYQVL